MTYPDKPNRARAARRCTAALLSAALLTLAGCQSVAPGPLARLPRFTEAEQADTVIKHYSWDYIFVLRPAVMDGPFRRILKAENIGPAIRATVTRRDLAVVLVGWQLSERDSATLGEHWRNLLEGEGFRRVVCIKPLSETKLNGSPVVYDSAAAPRRALPASL